MTLIKIPKGWELPESAATSESIYRTRRQFVRDLGLGTIGLSGALSGCFLSVDEPKGAPGAGNTFEGETGLYPAQRNPEYVVTERELTPEDIATRYNNFYEFTVVKDRVWELVDRFETNPWSVEIKGLVHRPQTLDLDQLLAIAPLEERVYRHRCVEAWSMTVPWTGFPLSKLLEHVEPMSSATHVRMVTALRPEQMPGVDVLPSYPWPYFEGLRMDEAMNELALMVTGLYGKPLPRQNGAPIRLITPWKYGYKSIKSVIEIELVDEEPPTFWNELVPHEYGFISNVDPNVPHPRWSQARERDIGTNQDIPTLLYNGYAEYVAHMYA